MRYWMSLFSLEHYKHHDDSRDSIKKTKGTYYHLKRKANGRETYGVLHMTTVNKIRNILSENTPIGEEEEKAREDMQSFIDFVDENIDLIQANNYNVVFYTDHSF